MEKLYKRTYWKNAPDNTTPLNKENLDNIEAGIDGLDDRVVELKSDLSESYSELKETLANITEDITDTTLESVNVEFTEEGFIDKNKQIQQLSGYYHGFVEVEVARKYKLTNRAYSAMAQYAFADENKTITYANDNNGGALDTFDIVIPSGVKYLALNHLEFVSLYVEKNELKSTGLGNLLEGLKLVVAGDSITEGAGVENEAMTYGHLAKDYYNLEYLNIGMSGRTMADVTVGGENRNGFAVERYLLVPDDTDILTIWFGYNDAAYGWVSVRDDYCRETYGDVYSNLTEEQKTAVMDYKSQDEWITEFIGTIESTDTKTWCGAWNFVLNYFVRTQSIKAIGVILPYGVYADMITKLKSICDYYAVPYIDSADKNQILSVGYDNKSNYGIQLHQRNLYTTDGLHPNAEGYKRIAKGYIPWLAKI